MYLGIKRGSITLILVLLTNAPAWAFQRIDREVVKTRMNTRTAIKQKVERARQVVQKTPDFALWDGDTKITPSRTGLIYYIEKAERDRVLLSLPSQGLQGWVPRDSILEYNQAEPYFTTELDLNPETSFAYLMRAIVSQDATHIDRAFADLNEAIRLDPRNISAWIERAFIWQLRNRMDLAIADVSKAIQIDPKAVDAYVERGVFQYNLKHYNEAFRDLERAIELGTRSIYVGLAKGTMLMDRKALDEAETEFRNVIQLDSKNVGAFISIGTIQLMRSQPAEAVKTFSHALQLEAENPDAYGGRASAYMGLGENKAAIKDLNNAIRVDPSKSENYRNRATVCSYLNEWPQAIEDIGTAVRLAPNDTDAQVTRAWMLSTCPDAKLRDGTKAIESATRACELTQWKAAHPIAALAAAYAETGDFNKAVKWQQQAIALSPGNDAASRTYLSAMERYRERKPYHRLGVLEEWGIRKYQPATPSTKATSTTKSKAIATPPTQP